MPPVFRSVVSGRMLPVLFAILAFNLGASGWSAVVAGQLTLDGADTAVLGTLYAVCELSRLPAALMLPMLTLKLGARRITQAGLLILLLIPLIGLTGLGTPQVMLIFVLSALPTMAVYVGMPALVIGASEPGRDGTALAWLGLAGGAGGALGPWLGGALADTGGLPLALALYAAGSLAMLPVASFGKLPPRTAWPGWSALAGRGLPWQALGALGLASAADAGRAALVPSQLIREGQALGEVGMLLTAGSAVAGIGFLAFGRMADSYSASRVTGAGVLILVLGSFACALTAGFAPAFVVASAVLGMGASGARLGAEVALIGWVGRDRAAVAAALGETTVLGGRAFGAPAAGTFGTAYGGASAFWAIGLSSLLASGVLVFVASRLLRRGAPTLEVAAAPVPVAVTTPPAAMA